MTKEQPRLKSHRECLRGLAKAAMLCFAIGLCGAAEAKWSASWKGGWYLVLSDGTWTIECARSSGATVDLDGTTYESPHTLQSITKYPEGGGELDMSTMWEDLLEDKPTWTLADAPVGMYGSFYSHLQSKNVTSIKLPSCMRVISGWNNSNSTPVYNGVTTNIVCNQGLNSIKTGFFSWMTNLVSVTGLDTVRHFGSNAFKGCVRLRSIDPYLPSGLVTIQTDSFNACTNLTGDLVYSSPECRNVCALAGRPATISFNDAITNISMSFAFAGLESVGKFPASLHSVNACFQDWGLKGTASLPLAADFSACTNLTALPAGFAGGSRQLRSVVLPPRIKSIGNDAMLQCINLTNVSFVADMRFKDEMAESGGTVGDNAFRNCNLLKSVVLPWGGGTTIGTASFTSCPALKRLKFEGCAPTVSDPYGIFYKVDNNSYSPPDNYKAVIYASPKRGRSDWKAFATREPTAGEKANADYPGDQTFGVYVSSGNGNGSRSEWLVWEAGIWDDKSGLALIFR